MQKLTIAILAGAAVVLALAGFHSQETSPIDIRPKQGENPLGLVFYAPEPDPSQGGAQASVCHARVDCADGSTLSCSDTTNPVSCLGEDQDCEAEIRGFVQCNGGLKRFCPQAACNCLDVGICSELDGQSCSPNFATMDCCELGIRIINGCSCENGTWSCISIL